MYDVKYHPKIKKDLKKIDLSICKKIKRQSHLGKRSQAEPGNEHRSEFAST